LKLLDKSSLCIAKPIIRNSNNKNNGQHKSDWTHLISSVALATLKTNKFNKPSALPVTSDLLLHKNYLDTQMTALLQQLGSASDMDL